MENMITTTLNYRHEERLKTPTLVMKEYIEQVKDNMVDKVEELEKLLEEVKKCDSPIRKYKILLDYQEEQGTPGYKTYPDELYNQIFEEIFGYMEEGEFRTRLGKYIYRLGPLDFSLSTRNPQLSITERNCLTKPEGFDPFYAVTVMEQFMSLPEPNETEEHRAWKQKALEEAMLYRYMKDYQGALKALRSVLEDTMAEYYWRRRNRSEEPWEAQKPLKGFNAFRSEKNIRLMLDCAEDLFMNIEDKAEERVEAERKIQKIKERDAVILKLKKKHHIPLLLETFQAEGFLVREFHSYERENSFEEETDDSEN